MQQRCSRDAAEMQRRCSGDAQRAPQMGNARLAGGRGSATHIAQQRGRLGPCQGILKYWVLPSSPASRDMGGWAAGQSRRTGFKAIGQQGGQQGGRQGGRQGGIKATAAPEARGARSNTHRQQRCAMRMPSYAP